MKVRLYMDVPEYVTPNWSFFASSAPLSTKADTFTRVMFEVDIPTKEYDAPAPATRAVEVPK